MNRLVHTTDAFLCALMVPGLVCVWCWFGFCFWLFLVCEAVNHHACSSCSLTVTHGRFRTRLSLGVDHVFSRVSCSRVFWRFVFTAHFFTTANVRVLVEDAGSLCRAFRQGGLGGCLQPACVRSVSQQLVQSGRFTSSTELGSTKWRRLAARQPRGCDSSGAPKRPGRRGLARHTAAGALAARAYARSRGFLTPTPTRFNAENKAAAGHGASPDVCAAACAGPCGLAQLPVANRLRAAASRRA